MSPDKLYPVVARSESASDEAIQERRATGSIAIWYSAVASIDVGAGDEAIQERPATGSIAIGYLVATSIAVGAGDDQIASSLEDSLLATTGKQRSGDKPLKEI